MSRTPREIFAAACEATGATPVSVDYAYSNRIYYFTYTINGFSGGVGMGDEMTESPTGDVQGLLEDHINRVKRDIVKGSAE